MRWWHGYFPFPTEGTESIRAATRKYSAFHAIAKPPDAQV